MSTSFSEELLSAYLDGELSPAERAALEERLESHPRLRERLAELREVSELLRQMPRPAAPAGLREQVMARVLRHSVGRAVAARLPRARRKAWMAGLAASLLLGVVVWRTIGESQPDHGLRVAAVAPPPQAVNTPAPAPESPPVVAVYNVSKDEIRRKLAELEGPPEPGNVITVPGRGIRSNGFVIDPPVLIEMTVVDVVQSMNQLQVLLKQQQQGPPVQSQNSVMNQTNRSSRYTSVSMEVEMDGPQLAEVLNDLPALDATMYVADIQPNQQQNPPVQNYYSFNDPNVSRFNKDQPDASLNNARFGNNQSQAQNFRFPVLANQDAVPGQNGGMIIVDQNSPLPATPPSAPGESPQLANGQNGQPAQPVISNDFNGDQIPRQEQIGRQWDRLRAIRAVVLFHQHVEPSVAAPKESQGPGN